MRLRARILVGLLALLTATGCSASPDGPGGGAGTEPVRSTAGTVTRVSTITAPPTTSVIAGANTTIVTTPTDPTLVPPPASTSEPPAAPGECPYLTAAQVRDANGQNVGAIETIATEPHPICIFHRPDGTVMAVVRIIIAATPEQAAAAVNQHVPIDLSFPVSKPAGWEGGAIGNAVDGIDGYVDGRSIYGVSKGEIAIIAISNQKQSIKGRQMVADVIESLGW